MPIVAALILVVGGLLIARTANRRIDQMSQAFARLASAVEALSTVGESVGAVVDRLVEELRAAAAAPTEADLNALADRLESERTEIVDAVKRGTVAEDEPEPEPADGDDTGAADDGPTTIEGGDGEDQVDPA